MSAPIPPAGMRDADPNVSLLGEVPNAKQA